MVAFRIAAEEPWRSNNRRRKCPRGNNVKVPRGINSTNNINGVEVNDKVRVEIAIKVKAMVDDIKEFKDGLINGFNSKNDQLSINNNF